MYHTATYELLGARPTAVRDAAELVAADQRLGLRLPEAMREWYLLREAVTFASRQNRLCRLDQLQTVADRPRYLHVMTENQGVCVWSVDLDGGPNPPVLVNVEDA